MVGCVGKVAICVSTYRSISRFGCRQHHSLAVLPGMTAFLIRVGSGLRRASLAIVTLVVGQVGCELPSAFADAPDRLSIELSAGYTWAPEPYLWHDPRYAGYYWYSPCYPFASCAAFLHYQMLERRRERFQALQREAERKSTEVGIETWGGWPENYQRRATAPRTAEAEIQPEYRSSSQSRPEYDASGEFLPGFLEGRERTPR